MEKSKKIIWEAFDHIREKKSTDWFWGFGIVAGGIIILSIYFNNILFALLILIGTLIILKTANQDPRIVNYQLSQKGVKIDDIFYSYSNLESFYVIDEDGYDRDRIIIKSKKALMPLIVMPLGNEVDPEIVRNFLIIHLEEEEMYEPTIQRILTIFGF